MRDLKPDSETKPGDILSKTKMNSVNVTKLPAFGFTLRIYSMLIILDIQPPNTSRNGRSSFQPMLPFGSGDPL